MTAAAGPAASQGPDRDRRAALLVGIGASFGACFGACFGTCFATAARAQALDPAGEPALLAIGGRIARSNAAGEARFDLPMLEALPQQSFATRTPWYAKPRKFTGVRLRDLLAAAGAPASDVRAIALNDYRADIPAEDVQNTDVMVAYLLDDEPMRVRDKGPLVVIYPFDSRRELRTAVHYSRAVWQLHRLEVK